MTIETVDGHETDIGELRADPRNTAVVDADIILALVRPKARAAAGTPALKQVGTLQMPEGLLAVGAHTSPFSGQGVTVAVLDTGIDKAHPAFKHLTIQACDFTGEGATQDDVRDTDGHGTHCAGTVCGGEVNGIRVGVAPGVVKLCVGKVLGINGGTLEAMIKGMVWAVSDEKAVVVSMSLGYDLPGNSARLIQKGMEPASAAQIVLREQSQILKGISKLRAFLEWQSPNVVFVAATGNESARPDFVLDAGLPAAELLPVGAVGVAAAAGGKWEVAEFSNGLAQVVAPGVDVVSAAAGGGWAAMSGTSMATPHVAGVAALWTEKIRNGGLLNVPDTLRAALRTSATRLPLIDNDVNAIGLGMVQAPQ
jgi:subtilisin family serine protease